MNPLVMTMMRDLQAQGVDLRFRCNRRRLVGFTGTPPDRRCVIHPGLLRQRPTVVATALRDCAGRPDPAAIAVLQQAVDELATELPPTKAEPGSGHGRLADYAVVFGDERTIELEHFADQLRRLRYDLAVTDTDRLLVNLDGRRGRYLRVHYRLLDEARCWPDLFDFVRSQGRGRFPVLQECMRTVYGCMHQPPAQPASDNRTLIRTSLATHAPQGDCDHHAMLEELRQQFFPRLQTPVLTWSRTSNRLLQSIRYGSYRHRPRPEVRLHPRLRQPWIARIFVEHVLHHELCHHAQACWPQRGERPHGPRFKAWERAYPHYVAARAWERRYLAVLLDVPVPVDELAALAVASPIDA